MTRRDVFDRSGRGRCRSVGGGSSGGRDAKTDTLRSVPIRSCARRFTRRPAGIRRQWKRRPGGRCDSRSRTTARGPRPGRSRRASTPTWRSCRTKATWSCWSRPGWSSQSWNDGPDKGMITHSLVVIGHRTATPRGSRTGPTWRSRGSGCCTPIPRPPAERAGTSTRSTGGLPGSRDRHAAKPDPARSATSWRRSRPTWSTWTSRAARAWPTSPSGHRRRGRHLRERAAAARPGRRAGRSPT